MILIACATRKELVFWEPRPHIEMLVTGIGPVEAAAAVSRALAQSTYELVISAGISGALDSSLNVGDGVVVADEIMEFNIETGDPISLPPDAKLIDAVRSDLPLVDRLVELGFRSVRGVTVSRVSATKETASRLAQLGAAVESMEGFAVLRSAEVAGVPHIEVRGISNVCDDRRTWNFEAGVAGLQRILDALLNATGK